MTNGNNAMVYPPQSHCLSSVGTTPVGSGSSVANGSDYPFGSMTFDQMLRYCTRAKTCCMSRVNLICTDVFTDPDTGEVTTTETTIAGTMGDTWPYGVMMPDLTNPGSIYRTFGYPPQTAVNQTPTLAERFGNFFNNGSSPIPITQSLPGIFPWVPQDGISYTKVTTPPPPFPPSTTTYQYGVPITHSFGPPTINFFTDSLLFFHVAPLKDSSGVYLPAAFNVLNNGTSLLASKGDHVTPATLHLDGESDGLSAQLYALNPDPSNHVLTYSGDIYFATYD